MKDKNPGEKIGLPRSPHRPQVMTAGGRDEAVDGKAELEYLKKMKKF